MPTVPRNNKGVYVELDPRTVESVKALAERQGRTFAAEVREALRRHLAYPPPPPADAAPLPDAVGPKGGGKKKQKSV